MLSKEDNEFACRVGPGTPMGELFRRFWLPVMLPDELPSGGQGWFFNTRRDKLKDPKVREAVINAFDFEWTNKTVMYGAYARTASPFQNSDMVATGKPSPERNS